MTAPGSFHVLVQYDAGMADLSFNVGSTRVAPKPITFTLGNSAAELKKSEEGSVINADGSAPVLAPVEPHVFTFTPPKEVTAVLDIVDPNFTGDDNLAIMSGTFDWLAAGLSKEDQDILLDRLRDQNDALDTDDLIKVVEGLNAEIAKRPTS